MTNAKNAANTVERIDPATLMTVDAVFAALTSGAINATQAQARTGELIVLAKAATGDAPEYVVEFRPKGWSKRGDGTFPYQSDKVALMQGKREILAVTLAQLDAVASHLTEMRAEFGGDKADDTSE